MGQCGCGDGFGVVRLPGPDGTQYTIRVYNGCGYCGTGVAVFVERYTKSSDDMEFIVDAVPEAEFEAPFGPDYAELTLRVLDPEVLERHVGEYLAEVAPEFDKHWTAKDYASDMIREVFGDVLVESQREPDRAVAAEKGRSSDG